MFTCLSQDCTNRTLAQGLCNKHYKRAIANGSIKAWETDCTADTSNWTDINIAWVAGIIEGEGCIFSRRRFRKSGTPFYEGQLTVAMTDYDIILRLSEILRIGNIRGPIQGIKNKKPYWVWSVSRNEDLKLILKTLMPWFGIRRKAKAELMLELLKHSRSYQVRPRKRSCSTSPDL
jgi:hypothetical protein